MSSLEITAQNREKMTKGEISRLRKNGSVPAVIYGGKKNLNLFIGKKDLKTAFGPDPSPNAIYNLKVQNGKESTGQIQTMIKELQYHPISYQLLHIDFMEVIKGKKIYVSIPIKVKGKSECVKKGGILTHLHDEIDVECLPKDILKEIEVDVTSLEVGQAFHVRDIKHDGNIKIRMDPDDTILTLSPKDAADETAAPAEGAEVAAAPEAEEGKENPKETGK